MTHDAQSRKLLQKAGLKVTPARLDVLNVFVNIHKPLSVQDILDELHEGAVNQATVYRIVEALDHAGVVRRIDLHHDHVHYELLTDNDHHHIICESCGKVEDISKCKYDSLAKEVLKKCVGFKTITDHSLEFFGLCKSCARKKP